MKLLKAILIAAGIALAAGSVTAAADAQPRDRYEQSRYGNHHGNRYGQDRRWRNRSHRRGWRNDRRRCRTEYRHHRRVKRCW